MATYDTLMSISNTASSAKSTYAAARTIASNSQPLPEEDKEKMPISRISRNMASRLM